MQASRPGCLVIEWMKGGPVTEALEEQMRPLLDWRQRALMAAEATRGLIYLHTASSRGALLHGNIGTDKLVLV